MGWVGDERRKDDEDEEGDEEGRTMRPGSVPGAWVGAYARRERQRAGGGHSLGCLAALG